jgi:riboflavin biosynthesis pyrimidine reductase
VLLQPEQSAWRVRQGLPAHPPVAVVSSRLDLEPRHPLFAEAPVRPIVVTHAGSPARHRAELAEVADVMVCGEEAIDPRAMVAALAGRGLRQVLCEGGPHLFGSLIEADCVDELCLTISPVLEGGPADRIATGAAATTRRMALRHVFPAGDMLFLRYTRRP